MKTRITTIQNYSRFLLMPLLFFFILGAYAQSYRMNDSRSNITVAGTSTLHDWEVVSDQKSGSLDYQMTEELPQLKSLSVVVPAESLKSGKSGMDKNTYNALNTKQYKNITFELLEVKEVSPVISTSNRYRLSTVGNLTIAGQTRKIELPLTLTLKENQINLTGSKKFKMTQYGIEPPKALLGTIKTGDEIEVIFDTLWTK